MSYTTIPLHLRPDLWRRLKARYGEERANDIMKDRDPQSQADLSKWRKIGKPQ